MTLPLSADKSHSVPVFGRSISGYGSGAGNLHRKEHRITSHLLPATLRPPRWLDDGPQNSTPADYLRPSDRVDEGDTSVSAAGAESGASPLLALIIGLLALLWMWVINDDVMLLQTRLRRGALRGAERKSGCRCRVCILRIQARGQPLHNVRVVVAQAGKLWGRGNKAGGRAFLRPAVPLEPFRFVLVLTMVFLYTAPDFSALNAAHWAVAKMTDL
ncbi:hypothetical protein BC826DRAFT_970753 [Russula brevipes]|nr:hypothetical protein BC826DRAFT_970753 [Russula brevipes]